MIDDTLGEEKLLLAEVDILEDLPHSEVDYLATRSQIECLSKNESLTLGEDLRYLLDAQGIGGHCDGDDEHKPENKLTKYCCRGLAGLCSVEELLYATSFHPAVETHGLEDPCDDGLEYLGHYVANYQYYDSADQLRDEGEERIKTSSQRLDYLLTLPFG